MSEILVDYFSTKADGISGNNARLKSLNNFKDHPSVLRIQQKSDNWPCNLELKPVTQGQVLAALESELGYLDGVSVKHFFDSGWMDGWSLFKHDKN